MGWAAVNPGPSPPPQDNAFSEQGGAPQSPFREQGGLPPTSQNKKWDHRIKHRGLLIFHLKALAASVADPGFLYVGLLFGWFWDFSEVIF